jgi:hypothetical protein
MPLAGADTGVSVGTVGAADGTDDPVTMVGDGLGLVATGTPVVVVVVVPWPQ